MFDFNQDTFCPISLYFHFKTYKIQGVIMKDYLCTIRGYIYEPKNGDPDGGIKPGTSFEEIPDDWECPDCGSPKEDFEELED